MLNVSTYNMEGEETGTIKLPENIFDLEINNDLIYQAVTIQIANSRVKSAHAKDRSEVRGGGRKPWRQKGTGRARHGSSRSPIWTGGGVTFGPVKERNFNKKINKKAKTKALFMVLSSKVRDKEIRILEKLEIKEAKTRIITEFLKKLFKKEKPSVLIVTSKNDKKIIAANKNLSYIRTISANSLNVVDILSFKYLLLDREAIKIIEKTYIKQYGSII